MQVHIICRTGSEVEASPNGGEDEGWIINKTLEAQFVSQPISTHSSTLPGRENAIFLVYPRVQTAIAYSNRIEIGSS